MEQVTTQVEIIPHTTTGGQKPQGHWFKVTNFRYQPLLIELSRMLYAMCKGRSGNQLAEIVAREVTAYRGSIATFEAGWQFAKDHNNPVTIPHELEQEVHFPTYKQLQLIPNPKIKNTAMEVMRLAEVTMSSDSAVADGNVGPQSIADVERQLETTKAAFDLYLGPGGVDAADFDKTGIQFSVYKELGVVEPDFDNNYTQVKETSPETPSKGRPDAADRPVSGA